MFPSRCQNSKGLICSVMRVNHPAKLLASLSLDTVREVLGRIGRFKSNEKQKWTRGVVWRPAHYLNLREDYPIG